jgi:hypothetical protein
MYVNGRFPKKRKKSLYWLILVSWACNRRFCPSGCMSTIPRDELITIDDQNFDIQDGRLGIPIKLNNGEACIQHIIPSEDLMNNAGYNVL